MLCENQGRLIIFSVDAETETGDLPDPNDYVAQTVDSYPDVFIGFCSVDPRKGKAAVEGWVAVVRPANMLFEISGVSEGLAKEALALAAAKRLINEIPEKPTNEAFPWAAEYSNALFNSEEAAEGMAAFLEKRSPNWVTDK